MFSRQRTGCLRNANRQRIGGVLDEPIHHPTGLTVLKLNTTVSRITSRVSAQV